VPCYHYIYGLAWLTLPPPFSASSFVEGNGMSGKSRGSLLTHAPEHHYVGGNFKYGPNPKNNKKKWLSR